MDIAEIAFGLVAVLAIAGLVFWIKKTVDDAVDKFK